MLNHSQRVCEELKAQLKEEKRRSAKHEENMKNSETRKELSWRN